MTKKKRGRCVRKNKQLTSDEPEHLTRAPHSFVFHRGTVGKYVLSLVKDVRKILEPFTASNLKARRKNALKDFVAVSGLLHVSHTIIFTCSSESPYMRLVKLPRGPTLTFKIHEYVLARDVLSCIKKQYFHPRLYQTSPLLIMNGFSGEAEELKVMVASFQSMFPTINVSKIKLNDVHRCLLLNYNAETKKMDLRHYMIRVTPVGVSKSVKKLLTSKIPNLSRFNDIADFVEKADVLSESEGEDDATSHVQLPQEIRTRGNIIGNTSAIKLCEIGPRITISLVKVEAGLMDGEVLYHEYIHKTEEEKTEILKRREEARKLKLKRKQQQMENVKKKEALKNDLKRKSLEGMNKKKGNQVEVEDKKLKLKKKIDDGGEQLQRVSCPSEASNSPGDAADVEVDATDDDDDAEWYRKEVGKNPEPGLFQNKVKPALKRKPVNTKPWPNKRFKKNEKDGVKRVRWSNDNKTHFFKKNNSKSGASRQKSKVGGGDSFKRRAFKNVNNQNKKPVRKKRQMGSRVSKQGKRY